jgi:hypothetical protein
MRIAARISTLGYALPGAVLAVGIFIPIAWLDNQLIDILKLDGQILGGTLAVMLLAYCARFLAVGFGPLESGLGRITGVGRRGGAKPRRHRLAAPEAGASADAARLAVHRHGA